MSRFGGIVLTVIVVAGCQGSPERPAIQSIGPSNLSQATASLDPTYSSSVVDASPSPTRTAYVLSSPRNGFAQQLGWRFWSERFSGDVPSITEWNGRLVAAGGDETQGRMWTSLDASTWEPVDLPQDVAASPIRAAYVARNGGIVVMGFRTFTQGGTDGRGEAWTEVAAPIVSDPLVATGVSGFLMTDMAPKNSPLWESEDGIAWQPVELPGIEESPKIISIAVGDSGRLVSACKFRNDFERPEDECRIYSSTDGVTWSATEWLPTQVHVAWTGDEWLALGSIEDDLETRIQIWTAGDSLEWVGSGRITEGFANPTVDRLLVAGDHLVLKTGTSYTRSLVSADGRSWARSALRAYIKDAAEIGDELVVTGSTFEGRAAIWTLD